MVLKTASKSLQDLAGKANLFNEDLFLSLLEDFLSS